MAKAKAPKPKSPKKAKTELTFDYIKSNAHRVIFVSGAHGGLAPGGRQIVMNVFNERVPIPTQETYEIDEETNLVAKGKTRTARPGLVREVEATIVFDFVTARSISQWIENNLKNLEERMTSLQKSKIGRSK